MKKFNFSNWNLILGWASFAIALLVYALTVEPTASFWDCGEYIATSAKLEIGHPPGAPFFQMMGAFFAMFAFSADKVALMVNYMSVISSAFTILFLFWTITHLLKAILTLNNNTLDKKSQITILGSAFVGAMTYTFSDSFWFNAVEAEVYAMATFMTSFLFWLGLKWVEHIDQPRGNKWLILVSFVVGLSFGVHFMALLVIPAIGMLYYFKNAKTPTVKGLVVSNVVSVAVLLFIFKLLLPYTLSFFGYLEVFFVNAVRLPFNSGTIIAGLIVISVFVIGLRYTHKKNYAQLNSIVLCVLFILIGFSTWLMIPIRSNADTMINENSPSDARSLLAYYNLEQYPETHLFYGPMYTDAYAGQDEENPYLDDKPKYERNNKLKKYVIVNPWKGTKLAPNSKHEGVLPRMWSSEHAENYMKIAGLADFSANSEYTDNKRLQAAVIDIKQRVNSGEVEVSEYVKFINNFKELLEVKKPSFAQNIYYMLNFQMGYMYWRYLMWNFVGRQDDIEGNLNDHGNWLSGITFVDEMHLGSQKNLPSDALHNKARNTYFFLPFALGLIGFFFTISKSKQKFWILLMLFMFTGLALKVYLNERPFEPRERDYALIGSFYVFSIWVGFGVYALYEKCKKYWSVKLLGPSISLICLLAVPTVMAYQNWDDHDRSGRYTAQSMAKAYLDSIQKDADAMLFTIGDNDTFALWYAQEIEGYRTDIRTINTSLLATDWYIDQMKRKAYSSNPVPSQLTHDKYAYGVRDAVYFKELTKNRWNIKDFVNWISSDAPNTKISLSNDQKVVFYPTNKIRVPVNKKNVLESGLVKVKDSALIEDFIDIDLPQGALAKNRILMLDILANNDWKRPIYFTGGSFDKEEYIWMKDYLQLDGLVYKLVPIKTTIKKETPYEMGRVDSDLMFDIVTKWQWGNSSSSKIYHDPETRKNSISYRSNIIRLAKQLIQENQIDKAHMVMDIAMKNMPLEYFQYYSVLDEYVEAYCKIGEFEEAQILFLKISKKYQEYLRYYSALSIEEQYNYGTEIITNMERYRMVLEKIIENCGEGTFSKSQINIFNSYVELFKSLYSESEKYEISEKDTIK